MQCVAFPLIVPVSSQLLDTCMVYLYGWYCKKNAASMAELMIWWRHCFLGSTTYFPFSFIPLIPLNIPPMLTGVVGICISLKSVRSDIIIGQNKLTCTPQETRLHLQHTKLIIGLHKLSSFISSWDSHSPEMLPGCILWHGGGGGSKKKKPVWASRSRFEASSVSMVPDSSNHSPLRKKHNLGVYPSPVTSYFPSYLVSSLTKDILLWLKSCLSPAKKEAEEGGLGPWLFFSLSRQ